MSSCWDGVPDVHATEGSIAERVGEVEREIVVAKPAELLHQDHAQQLLPGHPFSTALLADLTTIASDEVLVHPLRCLGMLVEDSADRFDFTRMDVIVERGGESELRRLNAAHGRSPCHSRDLRCKAPEQFLL